MAMIWGWAPAVSYNDINLTRLVYMLSPEMIDHQWLQARVRQLIEDSESEVDPEESLILYGLDSLRVMRFAADLKEHNIHVSFEDLIKKPTLASWRELIASRQGRT